MKIKQNSTAAFTLIEMLVVIAILALLMSLVTPAVTRAMLRGRETQSVGNLRSVGTAMINFASENRGRLPYGGVGGGGTGLQEPWWPHHLEPYLGPRSPTGRTTSLGGNQNTWPALMDPLVPNGKHHGISDYGANAGVFRVQLPDQRALSIDEVLRPSRLIAVASAERVWNGEPGHASWLFWPHLFIQNPFTPQERPSDRDTGGVPALFVDGSVRRVPLRELQESSLDYLRNQ